MLKTTPLNALHRELGARMVPFGGWDMPVQYSGVIDEHLAVRSAAGLFDVSHMGEVLVEGLEALTLVQHLTTPGQIGARTPFLVIARPTAVPVDSTAVHDLANLAALQKLVRFPDSGMVAVIKANF